MSERLANRVTLGDEFLISVLTHFEILWGYKKAALSTSKYESFLSRLDIAIAELQHEDAVMAAEWSPSRENVVDALIAGTVTRYNASIWTKDTGFLQFLPKEKVVIV